MEQQTKIILGFASMALVLVIMVVFAIRHNNKKKAKEKQDELDRQEKKRQIEAKFKQELIDLYGDEIGTKLYNGQFFIGMTTEQLIYAKRSEPTKKEKTELKTKTKETWIYGNKSSGDWFVFEDGICIKITDR